MIYRSDSSLSIVTCFPVTSTSYFIGKVWRDMCMSMWNFLTFYYSSQFLVLIHSKWSTNSSTAYLDIELQKKKINVLDVCKYHFMFWLLKINIKICIWKKNLLKWWCLQVLDIYTLMNLVFKIRISELDIYKLMNLVFG
jgi:hypothetical protein